MEANNGTVPLICLNNICKKFPGVYALRSVSFDINAGEVHSIVGENGAGKSTLVKIISGDYKQNLGEYLIEGEDADIKSPASAIAKGIAVVYQELNVVDSLSIAENVFFGRLPISKFGLVNWKQLREDTKVILDKLGLDMDPDRRVGTLGNAQKQMVEIAKAISKNPKVIIMDEPTSALAPVEINNLFKVIIALKESGVGVIYISHKLDEILYLSDRITVLRDGEFITEFTRKTATIPLLINSMVGRKIEELFIKKDSRIGEPLLEVEHLSTEKIHDVSFTVHRGEIVGFSGLLGSGRTELVCALYGIDKRKSGTIRVSGKKLRANSPVASVNNGIGMVPESRKDDGILPNLNVGRNLSIASLKQYMRVGIVLEKNENSDANTMVEDIRIKTPSIDQLIINLSGGNQQKVILGRWLMNKQMNILIVDEPTRGIDVGSKAEIYGLLDELAGKGMAIIVMSSEMQEIITMCDRIFVMNTGRITGEFSRDEVTQEKVMEAAIKFKKSAEVENRVVV